MLPHAQRHVLVVIPAHVYRGMASSMRLDDMHRLRVNSYKRYIQAYMWFYT
jgi:hypothetical protein